MKKSLLIAGAVLVVLGLGAAGAGYWVAFSSNTTSYEGERGVKIPRPARFPTVLDSLEASGILASRQRMQWFERATDLRGAGWGNYLDPGYYRFASGASSREILGRIYRGQQSPVNVTILPGKQPEAIAKGAAQDMGFQKDDFLAALDSSALAQELETDTTHLFGYLMPETYQVRWPDPPVRIIRRAKDQFETFWTEARARRADSLGLSKDEVVTLASIIQWETGLGEELPTMAGVYLNRLDEGMPLQADPTVQYAILQKEGRKRRLLYEDYQIQHPYNTYQISGLPPGPVTNPSEQALEAVLGREEHDYLYAVATGRGGHYFNETLAEHNRDVQRFRQTRDSLQAAAAPPADTARGGS
ncbi:MAG: endolytic transglycosylase MltG [Bacteroidetes bacterium QS_9_68_14]|nr:MAG: endolytic transglycosylase MltG [Bacteroidetes bacterium QS_9_68_14]